MIGISTGDWVTLTDRCPSHVLSPEKSHDSLTSAPDGDPRTASVLAEDGEVVRRLCGALRPAFWPEPGAPRHRGSAHLSVVSRARAEGRLGTYKQALSALRFLYRWVLERGEVVQDIRAPRPERRLPVVLSFEEVHRFFAAIPSFKHRTLLMPRLRGRSASVRGRPRAGL